MIHKIIRHLLLTLFIATMALPATAQRIESGYIFSNDYKNSNDVKSGKGGLFYISGSYRQPLYMRHDSVKGTKMLTATISGKYASLCNKEGVIANNPEEIINIGTMLTYVAPITERWNLVATAGISLNAIPEYIRLQSIAITGGTIFMYRVNKELNIGIGAVVTTAYGEPVIIPTPFITWKRNGKFSIDLNMRGMPELAITTQIDKRTELSVTPIAIEGLSAVVNIGNSNKLYTQRIFKSTIGISHKICNGLTLYAQTGYIPYRSVRIQERSHRTFWKELFDTDKRCKFSPSGFVSIGVKYNL